MSIPTSVVLYQVEPLNSTEMIGLEHKVAHAPVQMVTNTIYAERLIRSMAPELGTDASTNMKITSVIFMNRSNSTKSGVLLCTRDDVAFIYVGGALLGYDGSGPHLSQVILGSLGLPESAFAEANDRVREYSHHYALRVTIG